MSTRLTCLALYPTVGEFSGFGDSESCVMIRASALRRIFNSAEQNCPWDEPP